MIVEDDPDMRGIIETAAKRSASYAAHYSANDGHAALNLIREIINGETGHALPDLVLSDLSMPRLDGFGLIEELRRIPETSRIPVAIMTSSDLPADREKAKRLGCAAFFHKPHGLIELTSLMKSLPAICGPNAIVRGH
jgi:CheY-like chemotaxis protein